MNLHTLKSVVRRPGVMLVALDDIYSMIDPVGERVLVVNGAAAWIWTHLGTNDEVPDAFAHAASDFINELIELGFASDSYLATAVASVGEITENPRIEASSALQVAANNSGPNPFV